MAALHDGCRSRAIRATITSFGWTGWRTAAAWLSASSIGNRIRRPFSSPPPNPPRRKPFSAIRTCPAENGSGLAIAQLNRKQNTATVFIADPQSGAAKAVFSDRDDAWVDVPESGGPGRESGGFDWLNNGKRFLWLSERDGWRHAYSISRDGGEPVPITSEAADVIGIEAVDPDSRWIYFLAAPGNATQRYLYRSAVDQPGPAVRLSPVEQPGTHFYRISPNCQWAFHPHSRFVVLAEGGLRRGGRALRAGTDRSGSGSRPAAALCRCDPGGRVGLEWRRFQHSESDVPVSRPV